MRSSLTLASLMVTAVLAAQAPEFRSGVQLLRIDASVRDKSGNPVTDLRPSDFTVTIDGKLRPVVFAQLFRSEPNAIVVAGDQTVGLYKANTESPAGQIVVFVVDRNALPPGTERPILESAAAMLAELPPGDAVGLASIPGPVIELTRDHAKIEQALRSITGAPQLRTSARNVTWDEAKAFARGDSRVIGEVMDRECASGDSLFCPKEVNVAAREVLAFGTAHAEMLLSALTSLARDLATVRGPKHLVLLSAGLPFDVEFVDRFKAFERAAAEARIVVDTVRLHAFTADASSDSKGGANLESPSGVGGLDTLATLTGGFPYLASGRGTGIFSRIISDVTTFYELGIESTAQDANGKLHDVKVRVNRPGLETRAAPSISVPAAARAASALDGALKQPTDEAAVSIAVSTYVMFSASGAQRVVVAAELGVPGSAAPAEWGAVVLKDGRPVADTRGRVPPGPERPHVVMTTMELPPAAYRLRVGAVDADGRIGTLEVPFTVPAHDAAAAVQISDLMLGTTQANELEPRSRISGADELTALVQVSGTGLDNAKGSLQLVPGGSSRPAAVVPLASDLPTGAGSPIAFQASVVPGTLSAGRYTAIATIQSGDRVLSQAIRIVEITTAAAPDAAVAPKVDSPAPPLPSSAVPSTDVERGDVMKRVAAYVESYGQNIAALVGVERYSQRSEVTAPRASAPVIRLPNGATTGGGSRPVPTLTVTRTLTSEVALVRNSAAIGGWLAFRDVMDVDGKPVSDRGDRLHALFDAKTPDLEAAQRISNESARFNLGPIKRTFNVPTATLLFFHPANLRRFAFKAKGAEQVGGVYALVIDFQETAKPTLVMNSGGHDVASSGTLWIDRADGHVVKTRLVLTGYAGSGSRAIVEVTYRHQEKVDIWVPASMREFYETAAGRITATAEYTNFRRFETSAHIK